MEDHALTPPTPGSLAEGLRYTDRVPTALHPVNAHADDGTPRSLARMVDALLSAVGLVREQRRAFISYARAEATGVAEQLATELVTRGYEVFLDTWSVEAGVMFQEALWDRMAGCDVVVFCGTAGALGRRWVREEFDRAGQLDISLLHLVWPEQKRARELELSEVHYLTAADFRATSAPGTARARLRVRALREVVDAVECLRLQAFAARRGRLEEALLRRVRRAGMPFRIEPGRWVVLETEKPVRLVPVVGLPEARDFWLARPGETGAPATWILHDARGLTSERRGVLDHLAEHLPVGLLERRGAGRFLRSLEADR